MFKYDALVGPLQQGTVWRTNCVFKLAHVISSGRMQQLIDQVANEAMVIIDQHTGWPLSAARFGRNLAHR